MDLRFLNLWQTESPKSSRSLFRFDTKTAVSPPALRTNPPPCRSSRRPCLIPFSTNTRYFRQASFKWAFGVGPQQITVRLTGRSCRVCTTHDLTIFFWQDYKMNRIFFLPGWQRKVTSAARKLTKTTVVRWMLVQSVHSSAFSVTGGFSPNLLSIQR